MRTARYGRRARKVFCPRCGFPVYRGNLDRHLRTCTKSDARRERERWLRSVGAK